MKFNSGEQLLNQTKIEKARWFNLSIKKKKKEILNSYCNS